MSQLILDDQLSVRKVLTPLQKWITVERLQDLRSGEVILDDRVPEILRSQKQATFVTMCNGLHCWCASGRIAPAPTLARHTRC
jgi:hypothetical protein